MAFIFVSFHRFNIHLATFSMFCFTLFFTFDLFFISVTFILLHSKSFTYRTFKCSGNHVTPGSVDVEYQSRGSWR